MEFTEYGVNHKSPPNTVSKYDYPPNTVEFNMAYIQGASQDLKEVYDIAQRGGMLLHLTDCHLESARLMLSIDFDSTQDKSTEPKQKLFD